MPEIVSNKSSNINNGIKNKSDKLTNNANNANTSTDNIVETSESNIIKTNLPNVANLANNNNITNNTYSVFGFTVPLPKETFFLILIILIIAIAIWYFSRREPTEKSYKKIHKKELDD